MERQTGILASSVEAQIEEKRARVKVVVNNKAMTLQSGVPISATFQIENYGPTPAFVDDFRAMVVRVEDRILVPNYDKCRAILYSEAIQSNSAFGSGFFLPLVPEPILTEAQVLSIQNGAQSVHFYGFARYRDIFSRQRKMTIHLRLEMRFGGMIKGQVTEWWEPVGAPSENADREEENPN